jgi:hypothetical protein
MHRPISTQQESTIASTAGRHRSLLTAHSSAHSFLRIDRREERDAKHQKQTHVLMFGPANNPDAYPPLSTILIGFWILVCVFYVVLPSFSPFSHVVLDYFDYCSIFGTKKAPVFLDNINNNYYIITYNNIRNLTVSF